MIDFAVKNDRRVARRRYPFYELKCIIDCLMGSFKFKNLICKGKKVILYHITSLEKTNSEYFDSQNTRGNRNR